MSPFYHALHIPAYAVQDTQMSTANPPPRYVDGYPSLAAFIASDRDGTTSIYKRFNRLAARNLLLLQSELADLQAQLDQFDLEDKRDNETLQSLRCWEDYKKRTDPSRLELVQRIRVIMKEYSKLKLNMVRQKTNSRHNGHRLTDVLPTTP